MADPHPHSLSSGLGEARMALCFRFTSSTFSAILSIKLRISSTWGPRSGRLEETSRESEGRWATAGARQQLLEGPKHGHDFAKHRPVHPQTGSCWNP